MPNPILTQLTTLHDAYALHLARIVASPMDPVFRQARVTELQAAITILDDQIANQQKGA